jgi:serine/threonine protein kinase
MFQANQQIDNYTLIEKIGSGSLGSAWLAKENIENLDNKFVLKFIPNDYFEQSSEVILAAVKFGEYLEQNPHSHILPIIAEGTFLGVKYIVSKFIEGGSLAKKLKYDNKPAFQETVRLTIGILQGLEFLHQHNITHQNIKPKNILFQGNTPLLADFDVTKIRHHPEEKEFEFIHVGEGFYEPPEAFNENLWDKTGDIWSVGLILYQMLNGNLPLLRESSWKRVKMILLEEFAPLPNDVPNFLQEVVKKCLQKNSNHRYQTALEMSDDLTKWLSEDRAISETQAKDPNCFVCEPALSRLSEEKPFQWLETRLICQNHYNSAVLESGELVEAFIDRRTSKEYQFEGSGLNYLVNPVVINGIYGWNNFVGGGRYINEEIFPSRNYFEFYAQHNIDTLDTFYALYKGRELLEKEINVDNLIVCLESKENWQKTSNLVSVWNSMTAIEEELAVRGKTRVESPDEAREIFYGHKKYEHNFEQLIKTVAALLELGKSRFVHLIEEA